MILMIKLKKSELRNELLKKKTELDLPITFDLAVRGHYDAYCISGTKSYLETMLKFSSQ
jgi:hypothetical protein